MILATIILAALANHLWQSTLFAVAAAALLALAFRKNRAETRHALWLIASLKFLIPFVLLTSATGTTAAAIPIVLGLINTPQSQVQSKPASEASLLSFEVASIKPNNSGSSNISVNLAPGGRFTARNFTVKQLIEDGYDIQGFQISGAPGWLDSARYDIVAKAANSPEDDPSHLSESERKTFEQQHRRRLQSLLAARFRLQIHNSSKEGRYMRLSLQRTAPSSGQRRVKSPTIAE
jgi:hypothetical protein